MTTDSVEFLDEDDTTETTQSQQTHDESNNTNETPTHSQNTTQTGFEPKGEVQAREEHGDTVFTFVGSGHNDGALFIIDGEWPPEENETNEAPTVEESTQEDNSPKVVLRCEECGHEVDPTESVEDENDYCDECYQGYLRKHRKQNA